MAKRSKFSLSNYKLLSLNQGVLVPVGLMEVLPGDTIQQSTSCLIRSSPLVAPVMHPVHARLHHWFVPYRLIWDEWEDFITGGPDGMNASVPPKRLLSNIPVGSLWDYLGVVPNVTMAVEHSMLPVRAYQLIWNEHYRDQDLQPEAAISKASGSDSTTSGALQNVAWEKDYFTSARPWEQKGPVVTIPLGTTAPVVPSGAGVGPLFNVPTGTSGLNTAGSTANVVWNASQGAPTLATWNTPGLVANLATATSATINALRRSFAIQRYEEARARYGSRYTEYLRSLGVRSSDARLQRPEYLGGGKQTIQFSEVLQTAPSAAGTSFVGDMKGHGIGAMRSNRYRRFFEEHGLVLSLLSIKPRTVYMQSMHRLWYRKTKEDFWQRELEHIGQQGILNGEIYAGHAAPEGIFGYQDRYDEYRRIESTVSGEFRTVLNYWHMGRDFATPPVLNADFVKAVPTNRVYASTATHQMYVMAMHSIQARRMLSAAGTSHIY